MSKIRADKIEYDDDNFIVNIAQPVEIPQIDEDLLENEKQAEKEKEAQEEARIQEELLQNRIKNLIDEANANAQEILSSAQAKAEEIMQNAHNEASKIIENANIQAKEQAQELISTAQEQIENERIEKAKIGYEEGHKDGQEKIQEELEEKIKSFDEFCATQFEVKNKILKSLKNNLLEIVLNATKKILQKELDAQAIDKIITKTIQLLEKKEDVNVILSEKYARLLLELQNRNLGEEDELSIEDLKNYKNFNLICNPKIHEDTIIVENLKERFDASIKSQFDILVEQIYSAVENEELDLVSEDLKNEIEQS